MTHRLPVLLCALLLCAAVSAEESPTKKLATKPAEKKVKKIVAEKKADDAKKALEAKKIEAKKAAEVKAKNLKKITELQQVAAKKYTAARKASAEATKALAEAEQGASAAEGDEAKKAAAQKVQQAKKKLTEAKKDEAKQRDAIRKAAAARVLIVGAAFTRSVNTIAVREKVDAQDPVERFALFLPGGPMVIEAAMTIDGKPFRAAREKLIGEMLAAADTDKDGKATWTEALKSTRFTLGRIRISNDQQLKQYITALDKNKNELVELSEVRLFVAQYFQGSAFALNARGGFRGGFGGIVIINGQRSYSRSGPADVLRLLDTDKDGVLSGKEIATAGERLKSRDADDNDLLYPQEIGSAPAAANNRKIAIAARQTRQPAQQLAVMLGPTAKAETLFKAIQNRYKNEAGDIVAESFYSFAKLFEQLDKNSNGKLDQAEVLALNDVKPHALLAVDLGKSAGAKGPAAAKGSDDSKEPAGPKGITLKQLSPEFTKSAGAGQSITVSMPGVKLSMVANLNKRATPNYAPTAKRYLDLYDKDNNGYLSKKEVPANFVRQFEIWDGDSDGKVYPKEIIASYTRRLAPQASQIRASAANNGNPLFQALDQSGDGRLSLREMRTANERILAFDENKDKQISKDEIPTSLSITFGIGNASYAYYRTATGVRPGQPRPKTKSDAPEWFTRMDRNGDGDVTLKEFLGDKETFERLDTNNDGFIEPKEAKAAEKSK